jgi:integrase/recombinase XerD
MAGVFKRKSDRERGKVGKYTAWWIGEDGKKKSCVGTTKRDESLGIARDKEYLARQVRLGLIDPATLTRRDEGRRPVPEHLEDFRLDLIARGDTARHVKNTVSAIKRLLSDAQVEMIGDISPDKVQAAVGRIRAKGRSARTCNHALEAVNSFTRWLADSGRLKDYPAGLRKVVSYPEKSDRRRVRRPLSVEEMTQLLETTEKAEPVVTHWTSRHGMPVTTMTGPERAMAYRLVMATGFRVEEVRTLTPERFNLQGNEPAITVLACYSKRGKASGKNDVQPIRRDFAEVLRRYLEGRKPGERLFSLHPEKNAEILYADLKAAGIEPVDEKGRVVDFHALRHSYVTNLIRAKVNPNVVQLLARHSSITLTLDIYTTLEDKDLRKAIEENSEG